MILRKYIGINKHYNFLLIYIKMKDLVNDIKNFDLIEQVVTLKEITGTFLESYKQNNSWKIRLIDTFIVFNFLVLILQFLYIVLNGVYPMNSLIAGLICAIGSITLAGKYITIKCDVFAE